MTTRNIVPRATGEGSIGTPEKKWNSANIKNINAESIDVENLDATNLDVENLDATNLDVENLDVHSESVSPVNTLQRGTTYAADDIVYTSKLNAKYYLLCITGGTTGSVEPSFVGAESNTEVTDGTVVWRVQTITSQEKAAGFPIGFEYFQTNPNVPAGSLPMLGGVYSRETYADLWDWVQTQTGYLITDSAWVTLSNTQNGNVPFYSSGDGSTTFRVPSLKCWIKGTDGVETVGTYLDAGLPNITGSFVGDRFGMNGSTVQQSGSVNLENASDVNFLASWYDTDTNNHTSRFVLDASLSNSIYGNADTVVPESIVGMWLVKCYGTVVDTGTIDEQAYIDEQFAINVPTGCVQAFAGNTTPQGWLLCDGSAVSRTQYSRLFGVIGTTYGAGDGTDTFNVPNLVDKFIQGNAVAGTEHSAGLPNITGTIGQSVASFAAAVQNVGGGAFSGSGQTHLSARTQDGGSGSYFSIDFKASNSNSIYGNSTTVQPPSVTMRYIIKY